MALEVFGCHYKSAYKPWYSIFLSQQISRTNQQKRLYEQPNRAFILARGLILVQEIEWFHIFTGLTEWF